MQDWKKELRLLLEDCKVPAVAGAVGAIVGTILIRIFL